MNAPTTMEYIKSMSKAILITVTILFALLGLEDVLRFAEKANVDACEIKPVPGELP